MRGRVLGETGLIHIREGETKWDMKVGLSVFFYNLNFKRKRIGYKRRASSMEAESEKEEKEEEKKGTEEEKKGTEEVKEEPMEVEPALPLTKKPRTLYSDMEGVRKETNLEKEEDEEEKESGDLRKKLQRKRIRKGNLKKRMGPRHILQNVD